jgi:hypothetical protein
MTVTTIIAGGKPERQQKEQCDLAMTAVSSWSVLAFEV